MKFHRTTATAIRLAALVVIAASPRAVATESPTTRPAPRADEKLRAELAVKFIDKAAALYHPSFFSGMVDVNLVQALIDLDRLDDARKRVEGLNGGFEKSRMISMLVQAEIDAGHRDAAVDLAATVGEPASSFEAGAYVRVQLALGDFDAAAKAVQKIGPGSDGVMAMVDLAMTESRAGKKDAAAHFKQAAEWAAKPDDFRMFTVAGIADLQDQSGDHAGAMQTLSHDNNPDEVAKATASIAVRHSTAADRTEATAAITKVEELAAAVRQENGPPSSSPVWAWMTIADQWKQIGDTDRAKSALAKAQAAAEAVDGSESGPEGMAEVAIRLDALGEKSAAATLLDRALEKAIPITANGAGVHALWMIASEEARGGMTDEAIKTVRTAMKTGEIDPAETGMLASGTAEAIARKLGPTADFSWIEALPNDDEKSAAYAGAANGLVGRRRSE